MRNDLGRILYARNLREHDVARRAGLTQSHLNRIKNGRVVPSLETALRICAALGLPVDAVFRLDPGTRARLRHRARSRPCSAPIMRARRTD
jgi:transcriptional regulator with XRE-family HTH domain